MYLARQRSDTEMIALPVLLFLFGFYRVSNLYEIIFMQFLHILFSTICNATVFMLNVSHLLRLIFMKLDEFCMVV